MKKWLELLDWKAHFFGCLIAWFRFNGRNSFVGIGDFSWNAFIELAGKSWSPYCWTNKQIIIIIVNKFIIKSNNFINYYTRAIAPETDRITFGGGGSTTGSSSSLDSTLVSDFSWIGLFWVIRIAPTLTRKQNKKTVCMYIYINIYIYLQEDDQLSIQRQIQQI